MMDQTDEFITITFGECAENHRGNQQIGQIGPPGSGFSADELEDLCDALKQAGARAEIIYLRPDNEELEGFPDLSDLFESACVLLIRGGVDWMLGEGATVSTYEALSVLDWDTRALMYGRVLAKKARHNLCFDESAQEPDYAAGKGRIIPYEEAQWVAELRKAIGEHLGEKGTNLRAEGNRYYDALITGIGFHGDTERRKVIAARFGTVGSPITFQWFKADKPVFKAFTIPLRAGDIYVMSEKAAGSDWRKSSIYTLRHATGCAKYTTYKPKPAADKSPEERMTVAQLKAACKELGIAGYSRMRKSELIEAIKERAK